MVTPVLVGWDGDSDKVVGEMVGMAVRPGKCGEASGRVVGEASGLRPVTDVEGASKSVPEVGWHAVKSSADRITATSKAQKRIIVSCLCTYFFS